MDDEGKLWLGFVAVVLLVFVLWFAWYLDRCGTSRCPEGMQPMVVRNYSFECVCIVKPTR